MKKVLVIDDNRQNQEAAISQLNESCNIMVVGSFEGAMNALKNIEFDAVLTDIMLPTGLAGQNAKLDANQLIPSGLAIALFAAGNGIPVCMVTDLNHHHTEPISLAVTQLELLNGNIRCQRDEGGKDWKQALQKIVGELPKLQEGLNQFSGILVLCEREMSIPNMKKLYPDARVSILNDDSVKILLELKPKRIILTSDFQEGTLEQLHKFLSLIQLNQDCTIATMLMMQQGLHGSVIDTVDALKTDYRFEIVDILSLSLAL